MGKDRFSRILIALDSSEPSMKATEYGIEMAKKSNNSQLIALHVIHSQIKYLYSSNVATLVTSNTIDTIVDTAKQEAQKWLTKIKEQADLNEVKLKIEFIVDPASVVGAIVDYAERENIQLIIIGSRGLSGFKKLLLGSTTSGVVTYAHCPVLVVK